MYGDHAVHEDDHQQEDAAAAGELPLYPHGLRFKPTDQELILYFLTNKVRGQELPTSFINTVDLYAYHPKDLVEEYRWRGEEDWYFFTSLNRKYQLGKRPSRSVPDLGYWKATGVNLKIKGTLGCKLSLTFFSKNPTEKVGVKTEWMMNEYSIPETKIEPSKDNHEPILYDWVLCRIYMNRAARKKSEEEAADAEEEEEEEDDHIDDATREMMRTDGFLNNIGTQCQRPRKAARLSVMPPPAPPQEVMVNSWNSLVVWAPPQPPSEQYGVGPLGWSSSTQSSWEVPTVVSSAMPRSGPQYSDHSRPWACSVTSHDSGPYNLAGVIHDSEPVPMYGAPISNGSTACGEAFALDVPMGILPQPPSEQYGVVPFGCSSSTQSSWEVQVVPTASSAMPLSDPQYSHPRVDYERWARNVMSHDSGPYHCASGVIHYSEPVATYGAPISNSNNGSTACGVALASDVPMFDSDAGIWPIDDFYIDDFPEVPGPDDNR